MARPKKDETLEGRFEVSKRVPSTLLYNWQILSDRVTELIEQTDSSNVEDVLFANSIIDKLNGLIESIPLNQKHKLVHLEKLKLTDDFGNIVTEDKLWVVGQFYTVDGKTEYYKRRIVKAKTPKEAIYKYNKVDNSLGTSLSCIGEKDDTSEYSLGIENEVVIE